MELNGKKTILYDEHLKSGGKMVEFGGFIMPVEYTGLTEEHLAVRQKVGLFDVSHMGEIIVKGQEATKYLDYLLTSNMKNAPLMHMTYGLMLYENGTVVDDLMVYKYRDDFYFIVVNASNKDKDFAYMQKYMKDYQVEVIDESALYGQVALQGPLACEILSNFTKYDLTSLKLFDFSDIDLIINNQTSKFIISRSGYTGSDGFEIYGEPQAIIALWQAFVAKGVTLCGLGCRDTLRFEAAMPLYGHEIDDNISPLEAGLTYGVCLDKEFIGSKALKEQLASGLKRKLVGLEIVGHGIARSGYPVLKQGEIIGHITTGYLIPGTNYICAMALIKSEFANIGEDVDIQIRKNLVKAKVRNRKFMNKLYYKK